MRDDLHSIFSRFWLYDVVLVACPFTSLRFLIYKMGSVTIFTLSGFFFCRFNRTYCFCVHVDQMWSHMRHLFHLFAQSKYSTNHNNFDQCYFQCHYYRNVRQCSITGQRHSVVHRWSLEALICQLSSQQSLRRISKESLFLGISL
jgi:hypothetical protein